MNQQNNNQNFLDARTLIAIFLVGTIFVGWQMYMQHKYPDMNKKAPVATEAKAPSETAAKEAKPAAATETTSAPEAKVQVPNGSEKILHYASENIAFDISSRGMGLKSIELLKYKTREGEVVVLGTPDEGILPLETRLNGENAVLNFQIEKLNETTYVGRAQAGGMRITKTMRIDPEKYLLDYKIEAKGSDAKFTGVTTALIEDVEPQSQLSALNPRHEKQEFYVDGDEGHDRVLFAKDDVTKSWNKVRLASVGSQYFTQTVLDKSDILPEAHARLKHSGKEADILLQYPVLNPGVDFQLSYSAFVGPKSLPLLRGIDQRLVKVVDFGYFSTIGRYIFDALQAFHKVVGNWGWAVVLLTLCVRLLVLPVNIYSFKSMRAMQAIQPQLKELRERYKDDQQKQQQATMALMREHKVNPISGCLPIFLQLPIFWALYQVLGNSIELYQAPFVLWIHDLSLKDPFYVLPVLMGLTMFVQQKITPNTMDPAQAKVMLLMPLVFAIFMAQLPSGLTLYMLVGAVFSVAQQSIFMKQPKTLSSGSKA